MKHPVYKYKVYKINNEKIKDNFIVLREVSRKGNKSLAAKLIDFKLDDTKITKIYFLNYVLSLIMNTY